MKNAIRCCISCILPCGALDVIRIVHSNGRVEEISGSITAGDIMKAYPKHILKKPSSPPDENLVPIIVIVPPEAELQRGKIYFLMPAPTINSGKTHRTRNSGGRRKRRESGGINSCSGQRNGAPNSVTMESDLLVSDRYLSEILSEKISTQRDRRRGRAGVWRPHLESISESTVDA